MRTRTCKLLILACLIAGSAFGQQVVYLQYRAVPSDREAEFVNKETNYWAKVARAAIDQGNMAGWSLWRKVGITEEGAPNYVFVNSYESIDKADPGKVWTADNLQKMGVSPNMVETNSFAPTTFDYWLQLDDAIMGDYKYAVVNYANPNDLGGFIEENKTLWKPLHQKSIDSGSIGMTSWGMMSVIMPKGNNARFSVLTWDGFNTMADAMKYLAYSSEPLNADWQNVLSQTKMGELMPEGFEYTILYERVASMGPE